MRAVAPRRRATRVSATVRRETVLAAFVREAVAVGSIDGVSMRNLGKRADCAPLVVYRIFGNRTRLVSAALAFCFARVTDDAERAVAATAASATERLARIATELRLRRVGDEEVFETLALGTVRRHPEHGRVIRAALGRLARAIVRLLDDGIRRGEFDPAMDRHAIAWHLVALGLFRTHTAALGLHGRGVRNAGQHAFAGVLRSIQLDPAPTAGSTTGRKRS